MNDNKVQKLSDDALEQISGGNNQDEIARLEEEIAQLEASDTQYKEVQLMALKGNLRHLRNQPVLEI